MVLQRLVKRFEGGSSDFKNVLWKFTIERGFEYTLSKNDKVRVTAQCKYRAVKKCMWHVHARIMPGNEYFHILGMDLAHTCGFAVRTLTNPLATAELVADLVGNDVRAKSTNPGSHIELESDEETKRFKRLFVAFGACLQGFNQCRLLIFLDAAHLKGRYRGTIMAATGKNGNQGIFSICFAIVDGETYKNWRWFLEHLRSILAPGRDITSISDRHMGLLMARRDKRNLRDHLKGTTRAYRKRVVGEFVRCAYAPTQEIFHQNMTKLLSRDDGKVEEFLTNLRYENWSNAFFWGQRYDEMTSNVVESFNAWIEGERHLPITILVDELRKKIMNLMSERREEISKWGCQICPEMDKRMRASFNESRTWVVSAAGDGVYEKWQLTGFPCAHAVIVLLSSGKDMTEYVDPYYFSQTFRASYSTSIHPIPTVWMPERPVDEDFLLPSPLQEATRETQE
ncbi:uncharacterized protein LOC131309420 [Rhododendron vialii]|uniref:uncharacterized protein LOC131309420 n=1 Tax=Rhododendron vialii TaxID=182163 RepID=UPI00265E21DD|nr:uncharacterized protein LOC131309420 [Rhododendron vialii]